MPAIRGSVLDPREPKTRRIGDCHVIRGRLGLDDLGTVAPGKSADFVVLDANPLDDISNTRKISRVYLRGRQVDRATLKARWTGVAAN